MRPCRLADGLNMAARLQDGPNKVSRAQHLPNYVQDYFKTASPGLPGAPKMVLSLRRRAHFAKFISLLSFRYLSPQACAFIPYNFSNGIEMAPRSLKMLPRWPPDGPLMAPRWPQDGLKMAARWPQDGPCMLDDGLNMTPRVQDGFRKVSRAQHLFEVAPKLHQEGRIRASGSTENCALVEAPCIFC